MRLCLTCQLCLCTTIVCRIVFFARQFRLSLCVHKNVADTFSSQTLSLFKPEFRLMVFFSIRNDRSARATDCTPLSSSQCKEQLLISYKLNGTPAKCAYTISEMSICPRESPYRIFDETTLRCTNTRREISKPRVVSRAWYTCTTHMD